MKKYTAPLVVAVLFVIAVFLGYKIYTTVKSSSPTSSTPKVSNEEATKTLTKVDLTKLSQPELTDVISMANQVGKDTSTIVISQNCQIEPQVLKIKSQKNLKVKNADSKEHYLGYAKSQTIAPGKTENLNIGTFKKGLNRYGCDNKPASYVLLESTSQ